MLEDKKQYERKVMNVFYKVLKKNKKTIFKKKIFIEKPEIDIINSEDDFYTSEVSICLYFQKDLLGIIEFFIFYEGQPDASLSEFQEWFQKEFEYFFRKAEKKS